MKSVMLKTTFREIRQSLGRYIAILAIIGLGVGFFAGLKATKPAMVEATQEYLEQLNFYDFRLLSTLGFEEQDVETFREQKGVETAVGSYSFDIICKDSEKDASFVVKTHSITEGVNTLYMVAGRMPENPQECVVDSSMYTEQALGQKLLLAEENEAEDLEYFKYKEYTIVGIVQSPLYIQFERGNTSLGNGQLAGFVYLSPEAFGSEAYTEVYVKFEDDFPLHSEAYKSFIKDKEGDWKLILKEAAHNRAESIRDEANTELKKAQNELETERAKAETELEEARQQLEDAAKQIEDGKVQLNEAKEEIAGGQEELTEQEKLLAEGEIQLNENEKLLLQKEAELNAGILTWQENNQQLMDSKTQLRVAEAELNGQENQLSYMEQMMGMLDSVIQVVENQMAKEEAEIIASEQEVAQKEAELNAYEEQMKAQYGQELPEEISRNITLERNEIAIRKQQIEGKKAGIEESRIMLEEMLAEYNGYAAQLEEGRRQLEEGKARIIAGWAELDKGEQALEQAWIEITNGQQQINAGKTEIANARQELADGRLQIAEAKKTLADGQAVIDQKEQELADGEAEYLSGKAEYEKGLQEFEEKMKEAEAELLDAQRKVKEINDPDTFVLGRNTNVGYVCFESDSNIVEDVSDVFPIFFFMVAALVCMTTMSRMIEEQRTQIGVLKGLGYDDFTIMGKYLTYSGSAALIGCMTGFFLFTYIFPVVIWMCYGMMYDVVPVSYYFDWRMLLVGLAVSILCSVGTTWYCCKNELKEVAAQLMRPKTPEAGKRIFLEYVPFIWTRLKFLQKVSLRNVFRYKKRFFMMIIGISGCTALILAGLGINDSVAKVIHQQYSKISLYDMSVTFSDEITPEILEEFEDITEGKISQYSLVMENSLDLQIQDITKSLNLIVFKEPALVGDYIDLHTVKEKPITYPAPGQAVISHKISQTYRLTEGSTVTFLNEEQKSLQAVLSGINENFVMNYVFMHEETYQSQLEKPVEYKTIYLNVANDEVDQHLLSADIMKMYEVASVTVNQDTMERFDVMMGSLDYIVGLVILCAAALAFIVLYNLTNINITERIREIATIKVLGFYKKETNSYVFRENMMLTVIGSLAGLLLGKLLHLFIMDCIQVDMVAFDVQIRGISYVYAALLTYLFASCVNLLMRKKIEKISMTESLKSVD